VIADAAEARGWLRSLPQCDDAAWDRLNLLVDLLHKENARQNLVSARSMDQVWVRHMADSAQLLTHVSRETGSWLDLGSGAGFPGLVIACLKPERDVILSEARPLRCVWLRAAASELGLTNVRVAEGPVEKQALEPAAVISARAFAPLPRLLTFSERFSTPDTLWLLPKGRSARQELGELRGWCHSFHVEQSLTDGEAGIIVGTLTGRKGKSRDQGRDC
jgi:16S rRNA (guanine527-N7)-methyltransferase